MRIGLLRLTRWLPKDPIANLGIAFGTTFKFLVKANSLRSFIDIFGVEQ